MFARLAGQREVFALARRCVAKSDAVLRRRAGLGRHKPRRLVPDDSCDCSEFKSLEFAKFHGRYLIGCGVSARMPIGHSGVTAPESSLLGLRQQPQEHFTFDTRIVRGPLPQVNVSRGFTSIFSHCSSVSSAEQMPFKFATFASGEFAGLVRLLNRLIPKPVTCSVNLIRLGLRERTTDAAMLSLFATLPPEGFEPSASSLSTGALIRSASGARPVRRSFRQVGADVPGFFLNHTQTKKPCELHSWESARLLPVGLLWGPAEGPFCCCARHHDGVSPISETAPVELDIRVVGTTTSAGAGYSSLTKY